MSSRKDNPTLQFYCLSCSSKKPFKGKRNLARGNLESPGLINHIKQKRDKDGQLCCFNLYRSLKLVNRFDDIDLSTSLLPSKSTPTSPPTKKHKSSPIQDIEFNWDENEDDDSLANDPPTHFHLQDSHPLSELLLPKSHTLHRHAKFSTNPEIYEFNIKMDDQPHLFILLNRQTLPSQKLLPHISLNSIYKSRLTLEEIEAKAKSAMRHMESQVDMDAQLDAEEEEVMVPDDYLEDDDDDDNLSWNNHPDNEVIDLFDSEDEHSEAPSVVPIDDATDLPPAPQPNVQDNQFVHPNYLLERMEYEKEHKADQNSITPEVLSHLQLLSLQDKHKFSLSAVSDILDWAHYSVKLQDDLFQEKSSSRDILLKKYRQLIGLPAHAYKFFESLVQWLPDNKPTVIRKRHFLDCVFELLTNPKLLGENSCNISFPHPTDPFSPDPPTPPRFLSELHHGYWWSATFKEKCRPGSNDILVPLVFEVDETVIDAQGKLTITPFNIKLGIFNMDTNTQEAASTTWFFLPNDSAEAANHEKTTLAVHKLQNLHSALREGFSELKHIMDNDIRIPWKLQYGGKEHDVNLVFAVAYVISDTAMHDKLCCHYGTRNQGVRRICRHCDCPTKHLVNPEEFLNCSNYSPESLHPDASNHEAYWKYRSHYPIVNACDELYYGVNTHKIHLATPGEVLHMHQKGAMVRVIESLVYIWKGGKKVMMDNISTASKQVNIKSSLENLDYLCHQIGRYFSRQSDRDRPRTKFRNSLFAKTKKNAHEQAGVLMCILLAMLTDRGRQVCLEERTMTEAVLDNFVFIIELILMLEAWMKQKLFSVELALDPSAMLAAFGYYLTMMHDICKRGGMGALLVKNHLILHLPEYIIRWGPPRGWDSANLERSHKTEAKWPAKLTQKRQETFTEQTSTRYSERRIIKVFRYLFFVDELTSENAHGSIPRKKSSLTEVCTGASFEIGIEEGTSNAALKWKDHPGRQAHPQCVLDFVCASVLLQIPTGEEKIIQGFTEYKKVIRGQSQIFRAHPSYRSTSRQRRDVWYDWGMFDLSSFHGYSKDERPGQILMFINLPSLTGNCTIHGVELAPNEPHAVVRLFSKDPTDTFRGETEDKDDPNVSHPYSYLTMFGKVNDHLHIIPLKYLCTTAIVIENILARQPVIPPKTPKERRDRPKIDNLISPLGEGFFVVRPRILWAALFDNLIISYKDE